MPRAATLALLLLPMACTTENDAIFAIRAPDITMPRFAGLETATADTAYSLRLHWSIAVDDRSNAPAVSYVVYVAETSGTQDFARPRGTFTGLTDGIVGGLQPERQYFVVVRARDEAGNEDKNAIERAVTTPAAPPTRRFLTEIAPLLSQRCTNEAGCHSLPSLKQEMDFATAQSAYRSLVGPFAIERPGSKRVQPRDSGESFVVRKIMGLVTPLVEGERMPPQSGGFLMLDEPDIKKLREWIDQGAPEN